MKKKIIVAPLNWGLGHATRCVPIIEKLLSLNFIPIIASDGQALSFLQKEFPKLEFIELPSYKITYSKFLKISLAFKFFSFLKVSKKENEIIKNYVNDCKDVVGIISDNRFGVYHKKIPSIYITHQVNVFSGMFTFLTTFIHLKVINNFSECWVPDESNSLLSGKLSSFKISKTKFRFIGSLSRFQPKKTDEKWEYVFLLSGPEPRRTQIEKLLLSRFKDYPFSMLLIQGNINTKQIWQTCNHIQIVNFMQKEELEDALNSAKKVVIRAGYSSIMDLSALQKKTMLIPTKGQTEQEYLAKYLKKKYGIQFCKENEIETLDIEQITFKKLPLSTTELPSKLFDLFKSK